jgi:hypothetical protein
LGNFIRRFYFEGLAPGGNILVAPSVIFLSEDKIDGDLCGEASLPFGDIWDEI